MPFSTQVVFSCPKGWREKKSGWRKIPIILRDLTHDKF